MSTADHILDQIDGTLYDWSVSDDAMRWTPDRPEPQGKSTLSVMGDDGEWQEVEGVTSVVIHVDDTALQEQLRRTLEHVARLQAERARQAAIAVEAFTRAVTEVIKPAAEQAGRSLAQARDAFRHLPEADGCDACGPPPPPRDRPAWQSPYGPAQRRR